jgi:ABC-2 type transport system ATP-binding protein
MEEAQELSDRVGIIDHGELIALGTQKELTQQVGEMESLLLTLDEGLDPEKLAETVRQVPGVLQANHSDHQVTVIGPEAEEVIAPVISKANEMGLKVRSIEIREPNLEAVFLHLTGRALRD